MLIHLDDAPLKGLTSWEIFYINDENCKVGMDNANLQVLPKARTNGLAKFNNGYELALRLVSPNLAAPILDQVGLWIVRNRPATCNDMFIVFKKCYKIICEVNENGNNVQRLSWDSDT